MPEPLLDVKDLKVHFPTDDGLVKAVDHQFVDGVCVVRERPFHEASQ